MRRRPLAMAGYAGLGIACVAIAAGTFLAVASPADLLRDRLIGEVKARTGRDLIVAGPASLAFFPRLALSLADVSFSAPSDMVPVPAATAPKLEVEVSAWSLLSRQPSAGRIVLHRPVIDFRIDANGRRSWDLAPTPRKGPAQSGDIGAAAPVTGEPIRVASDGQRIAAALHKLGPTSVRILDGTLRYRDERSGSSHQVEQVDLEITAGGPSAPLEARGSLIWRDDKIGLQAALTPARSSAEERPVEAELKLAGAAFEAAYQGRLSLAGKPSANGNLSLSAPSLQALATWLGRPALERRYSGGLKLSGPVTVADGQVSFPSLDATVGESSVAGSLAIGMEGARPRVSGNLWLSHLDFRQLLLRADAPATQAGTTPPATPDAQQKQKRSKAKGWSDETIDVGLFGVADVSLALSVERAVYKDMTTGPTRLNVNLQDKVAAIVLGDMQLYGGRGQGRLTLDATGPVLVTGAELALDAVSSSPLLKDALQIEWLEGRAMMRLALAGQGQSERQIMETLNGTVALAVGDGAIAGIDVSKLLRKLEQGQLSGLDPASDDKTPFSELAATFTIANGIAHNQDLRLQSPHVHVTGGGSVNLPLRQLDCTVRPKIVASASGSAGAINIEGLEVPTRISGPWERPTFTPDFKSLKAVIKDPERAAEALKQIGKNLRSQEVQDALKGLLGQEGHQRVKPREFFEKLLKKE